MSQKRLSVWVVIIAGLALLLGVTGLSLQGRGLRTLLVHRLRAVLAHPRIPQSGDFTHVIFLHHSTGRNLIQQGRVRERLTASGFQFWDHDYNHIGLTLPDGTPAGYSYVIPDDNTDPDGLVSLFAQIVYSWPLNAFSGLMQHEVIAFKSCFPVSNITSDEQLETYKANYLSMRDVMDRYPDRLFIVLTPPPLNPSQTDAEAAARARSFSNWLTSDEYLSGHSNVFTFDFFDSLAEDDPTAPDCNMLREAYRDGTDSHPNAVANETIGPRLVDFVIDAIHTYRDVYGGDG